MLHFLNLLMFVYFICRNTLITFKLGYLQLFNTFSFLVLGVAKYSKIHKNSTKDHEYSQYPLFKLFISTIFTIWNSYRQIRWALYLWTSILYFGKFALSCRIVVATLSVTWQFRQRISGANSALRVLLILSRWVIFAESFRLYKWKCFLYFITIIKYDRIRIRSVPGTVFVRCGVACYK